jgi:hypothetical protein
LPDTQSLALIPLDKDADGVGVPIERDPVHG